MVMSQYAIKYREVTVTILQQLCGTQKKEKKTLFTFVFKSNVLFITFPDGSILG